MKHTITLFLLTSSITFFAQDYNSQKGYIAQGYDVVAYFNNKAEEGNKKFTTTFNNGTFKFTSKKNLVLFKENPDKYIPQYGGYCAYAISVKAQKVSINPKTFEIRNGKLYLFYNSWRTNTLELWKKEGAEKLKLQADKNWIKIN